MKKILLKNQGFLKRQGGNDNENLQSSNCVEIIGENSKVDSVKREVPTKSNLGKEKEKVCTMIYFLESKSYVLKQQESQVRNTDTPKEQLYYPDRLPYHHQLERQFQQQTHQKQQQQKHYRQQQQLQLKQHKQQQLQQKHHKHQQQHQEQQYQIQQQQHHQQQEQQAHQRKQEEQHRQQQLYQQHQQLLSEFQLERLSSKAVQKRQRIQRQGLEYLRSPGTMKCADNNPGSFRCYFPSCYCHYSYNKHINPNLRQTYCHSSYPHFRYNGHGITNNTSTSNYTTVNCYPYSSVVNIGHLNPNSALYNDYTSMYSGNSKLTSNPIDRRVQRTKQPNEDPKTIDFNIGPIDYSMDSKK